MRPRLGQFLPVIEEILEADKSAPPKQRHPSVEHHLTVLAAVQNASLRRRRPAVAHIPSSRLRAPPARNSGMPVLARWWCLFLWAVSQPGAARISPEGYLVAERGLFGRRLSRPKCRTVRACVSCSLLDP